MRFAALFAILIFTGQSKAIDPKERKTGLIATFQRRAELPDDGLSRRFDPTVALTIPSATSPAGGATTRATWSGYIYIVTPGEYTFSANLGGGILEVSVDRKSVFQAENRNPASKFVVGKPVKLEAGPQPFQATLNRAGAESIQLELLWEGPGFRREPIPYFFFSHLPADRSEPFVKDRQIEHGRFLFEEHGCKNCHLPATQTTLAERMGPSLVEVGKRVYPNWLDAWLADPTKLRPQTTMPKMFADDEQGKAERYAVTFYLASLGGPIANTRERNRDENDAAKRGEKLFTTTGCAACHANKPNDSLRKRTDDDDPLPPYDPAGSILGLGTATGPQSTYSLGSLGSKTTVSRLTDYILDPHQHNPTTRMPNMVLRQNEARDIATFLCKKTDSSIGVLNLPAMKATEFTAAKSIANFDTLKPDQQWRELGKALVVSKGCANCHEMPQDVKLILKPTIKQFAGNEKYATGACLSTKPDPRRSPAYSLDESQRAVLQAFLPHLNNHSHLPGFDARVSLKRFMCLNCHTRDGEGGIAAELADKMKSFETADNADDARPPSLTHIGHKATPEWLKDVLLNKGRARPWMSLKMPQYGEKNVGSLVEALPHLEGVESKTSNEKPVFDASLIAAGRKLTGKEGYGCIACHDISGVSGGGTRGPDLAVSLNRVRSEWFERWMHNPQRLSPGTKMPQYFLDGKATNDLLNADPAKHIEAFRAYFSLGMGLPLPAGLEPPKGVVIGVKDRTQLLRTFMPEGAGTRSFAVGYPGNINLAYDSSQSRLAYAWAGNFLDASPVWTNRGGNPAKLLGPKFWTAPAGHPWAVTKSNDVPDFQKRASDPAYGATSEADKVFLGQPMLTFDGYSLDDKGNPTFRSTVRTAEGRSLTVSETPLPLSSGIATGFTRRFEVEVDQNSWAWFVAGATTLVPRFVNPANSRFKLEGSNPVPASNGMQLVLPQTGDKAIVLTVPVAPANTEWKLVPAVGGWQAILKLPIGTKKSELVVNVWAVPKDDDKLIKELK